MGGGGDEVGVGGGKQGLLCKLLKTVTWGALHTEPTHAVKHSIENSTLDNDLLHMYFH